MLAVVSSVGGGGIKKSAQGGKSLRAGPDFLL